MKAAIYRLGEYKIIESNTGGLRWEAHFGLGARQEGRCFRKGRILFIGPAESDCLGFLKGEFLENLKPLPAWRKTRYYCRGLEVYHCRTGKRVTKKEMQLWMLDRGIDEEGRVFTEKPRQRSGDISAGRAGADVAFRLQRYEIIKKTNGQIVWKTAAGPNTVSGGTCMMLEDVLFIGSRQIEQAAPGGRRFLSSIRELPKWDQTRYFCPKLFLHDCETGNREPEELCGWPKESGETETHDAGKGYKNNIEFKVKKSDLSENLAMFLARRAGECITFAGGLILLTASFFFGCLTRCWKALKERWYFRKGKRSSFYHGDDD